MIGRWTKIPKRSFDWWEMRDWDVDRMFRLVKYTGCNMIHMILVACSCSLYLKWWLVSSTHYPPLSRGEVDSYNVPKIYAKTSNICLRWVQSILTRCCSSSSTAPARPEEIKFLYTYSRVRYYPNLSNPPWRCGPWTETSRTGSTIFDKQWECTREPKYQLCQREWMYE